MDIKRIIKNNIKFITFMFIVIVLGIIGVTFAITISDFNPIGINTTTSEIKATIGYENGSNGTVTSTGVLLPISDSIVSLNTTDNRIVKIAFNITGDSLNPENSIYDISLHNIDMACELKTEYVKWRLYKEENMISEGNFSSSFDAMINNRLVLTTTQEDLTTNTDNYTLLIWISESCTGDIDTCDPTLSQSKYLNKSLNASIKVELSTKSKKELVRITSDENHCEYNVVNIPTCNSNLVYNGISQELVNSSSNYTLLNNNGMNAGFYTVVAKLNDNYMWSDETIDEKLITCQIAKKSVTITTLDQTITYGSSLSSTTENVTVSGLLSGHNLNSINLNSSIVNVGTGIISSSNAKIIDTNSEDVTNNYNFIYDNVGVITINSAE